MANCILRGVMSLRVNTDNQPIALSPLKLYKYVYCICDPIVLIFFKLRGKKCKFLLDSFCCCVIDKWVCFACIKYFLSWLFFESFQIFSISWQTIDTTQSGMCLSCGTILFLSMIQKWSILIDAEIDENVLPLKLNVNVSCSVFNYSAFQPINLIIMMSLKGKHWEECQVNGIAEPFILLSYALTYKQRIKHVHVLGINVFSCTVDMSNEECGLKLGLSRPLGTQAPSQRKSSLSRHACWG